MIEQILADFASAYDMEYVVLRYFNAAGAYETAEVVSAMILKRT